MFLNSKRSEILESRHRDTLLCRGHRFKHQPTATGKSENRSEDIECSTIRFFHNRHLGNGSPRPRAVARGDSSGSIKSSRIAARNWADCGNYRRVAVHRSLFRSSTMIYGVTAFQEEFVARDGSANRIYYTRARVQTHVNDGRAGRDYSDRWAHTHRRACTAAGARSAVAGRQFVTSAKIERSRSARGGD